MSDFKYSLISGAKSRKYRQTIAGFAQKTSSSTLTLKFRLDTENMKREIKDRFPTFGEYTFLYNEIEGVQKGSLTYLLFTVILSGFRLFSNADSALAFAVMQERLYALQQRHSIKLCSLSVDYFISLIEIISKKFKVETINIDEFCKDLFSNMSSDESSENILFEKLSVKVKQIVSYYSTGEELEMSSSDVGKRLFDSIVSTFSLDEINEKTIEDRLPKKIKKSAIAFDKFSSVIELNDTTYTPYLVVSRVLSRRNSLTDKKEDEKFVKDNLTTLKNDALSWLLGVGLKYLRQASVEDIKMAYGIPDNLTKAAEMLKLAADATLPVNEKFSSSVQTLSNFRPNFGGHIDSWVSNYISRLNELKKLLQNIPVNISLPDAFLRENEDFIQYVGLNRQEVISLVDNVTSESVRKKVSDSLARLLGKSTLGNATEQDVNEILIFSDVIARLGSFKEQIDNVLNQAEENKLSLWHSLKNTVSKEWEQWKNIKKLPKLNGLSGGVTDVERELTESARLLMKVKDSQDRYFNRLMEWVQLNEPNYDPYMYAQERQQDILNKHPNIHIDASELVFRSFFNKIGRVSRESSDRVCIEIRKWFKDQGIFANAKDFNKYFCNRLGSIYVSPFSRRNNEGYKLNDSIKGKFKPLLQSLKELISRIQLSIDNGHIATNSDLNSLLKINSLIKNFEIGGIKSNIPSAIADIILPDEMKDQNPLSESMKVSLQQKEIPSSTVCSIFNIYKSLISGFYTVLNREKFYLRTKFSWYKNNNSLFYVPKHNATWSLPERYLKNDRWKHYIDEGTLVFKETTNVDIDATFENILKSPDDYAELLVQLPHDWYFKMPFSEAKCDLTIDALNISKSNKNACQAKAEKLNTAISCRLIGPSCQKNRIDEILISNQEISASDMTLLVDESVDQTFLENGEIKLSYNDPEISLAIPLRKAIPAEIESLPFKRIVAIDQGEAGLAYAVFNLSDAGNSKAEPIAKGTIRIPSIRRLIKNVSSYRKKTTTQKFNQRYDSSMFNTRENVAGDVCGLIVGLMQRYRAFPILEKEVKNLESGSKQLSLVYKAVNTKFLYSDVDMQKSTRKAWWFNSSVWETNYLRLIPDNIEVKKKDITVVDGKSYKKLEIFPGSSVRAGGTSQICSCCGRNVFKLIRNIQEKGLVKTIHVDSNGETILEGETIKLYHRPSNSTLVPKSKRNKSYNAIKERAPWTEPLKEGNYDLDSFRKLVKGNLRRAPVSMRSKDTSQSRYYCVFKNCEWHNQEHHADENAAINIGRRFLADIILDPKLKK